MTKETVSLANGHRGLHRNVKSSNPHVIMLPLIFTKKNARTTVQALRAGVHRLKREVEVLPLLKTVTGKTALKKENRKRAVVFRVSASVLILTLAKHVNTSNLRTEYLLCNATTLLELITNFRIILHYFIIILVYGLFVLRFETGKLED